MNSIAAILMAGLISIVLSGCATAINGAPDPVTENDSLKSFDKPYADALDAFYSTNDEATMKRVRDRFVTERIALIDIKYLEFRQAIYQGRIKFEVGTDLGLLALNGLGAAVNPAGAKTAFAALSAGLVGSRTSIEKNVYYERTITALLSQMEALRNTKKVAIYHALKASTTDYPMSFAKSDMDEYYVAGSLASAIQAVTSSSATASNDSRARIDALLDERGIARTPATATAAGRQIGACYDNADAAGRTRINGLLQRFPYSKTITDFIFDPATVSKRDEFLRSLQSNALCQ